MRNKNPNRFDLLLYFDTVKGLCIRRRGWEAGSVIVDDIAEQIILRRGITQAYLDKRYGLTDRPTVWSADHITMDLPTFVLQCRPEVKRIISKA